MFFPMLLEICCKFVSRLLPNSKETRDRKEMQSVAIVWVFISKKKILQRKVINKLCIKEGTCKALIK